MERWSNGVLGTAAGRFLNAPPLYFPTNFSSVSKSSERWGETPSSLHPVATVVKNRGSTESRPTLFGCNLIALGLR